MQDNIILIDKPKGVTSFDCIRILRKELGIKKMGHAGTLDPQATGLMIIGIEKGTKKLNDYLKLSKTYEATILLGIKTDSGDLEGNVLEEINLEDGNFSKKKIEDAVAVLVGENELAVPIYSAIKRGGKPLYEYARKGLEVEIPIKKMTVLDANVLSVDFPYIKVFFNVESGVYIRSLVEEFGKTLGVPAVLSDLRRTSIGKFNVEGARKIPML